MNIMNSLAYFSFGLPRLESKAASMLQGQQRQASATDVKIISENAFVCASLQDRKIFLVKDGKITRTVSNTGMKGRPTFGDLLGYHGSEQSGCLAVTNVRDHSVSVYSVDLPTNSINKIGCVNLKSMGLQAPHGVAVTDDTIYFTTLGAPYTLACVSLGSLRATEPQIRFTWHYQLQAVAVINQTTFVCSYTSATLDSNHPDIHSGLVCFKVDHGAIGEVVCRGARFDGIAYDSATNRIFVCDQVGHKVLIYQLEINHDRAEFTSTLSIESESNFPVSFPHGIDFKNGILAVANYGTNSVSFQKEHI